MDDEVTGRMSQVLPGPPPFPESRPFDRLPPDVRKRDRITCDVSMVTIRQTYVREVTPAWRRIARFLWSTAVPFELGVIAGVFLMLALTGPHSFELPW